jgi:hypothetical protein
MGWKDRAKPVIEGGASWKDRAVPVVEQQEPESRMLEAGIEGLGQGASLGYGNELAAALEQVTFPVASFLTGQDVQADPYLEARDKYEARTKQLEAENPGSYMTGNIGGALATGIATAGLTGVNAASNLGKIGQAVGIGAGLGALQDVDNKQGEYSFGVMDRLKNAAIGGALGGTFQTGANLLKKAPAALASTAEDLAENATGATRTQAEKFAPDAGRQLLDRKLIKFGDSAENIAQRTGQEMDNAAKAIDESLKALDAKGVTASADNIVAELEKKIASLRADPSQADIVKKLENIVLDITATGKSNIPLSAAEQTKRGFNRMSKNWQDLEKGQAGKAAYLSYMDEVEKAANAADPALAAKFEEGKKVYGLLSPIQEAAEKRAMTLNQSPIGGFLDTASAGAGMLGGGPIVGAATALGRRLLSPRIASSVAVTFDSISKALMKSPEWVKIANNNPQVFSQFVSRMLAQAGGDNEDNQSSVAVQSTQPLKNKEEILNKTSGSKYAQVMKQAADKGGHSLAAANYVLSQRDPNYRKVIEDKE